MSTPIPRQFGKTLTAKQLQADMERVRRERELAQLKHDLAHRKGAN